MVLELEQDNLQQLIDENKNVIIQFSASWCGNCRLMKPKFKKFAQETENFKFVLVDAEKFPESRKVAQVNNLPTFASFKDGNFLNQVQTNKMDVLKDFIDEASRN